MSFSNIFKVSLVLDIKRHLSLKLIKNGIKSFSVVRIIKHISYRVEPFEIFIIANNINNMLKPFSCPYTPSKYLFPHLAAIILYHSVLITTASSILLCVVNGEFDSLNNVFIVKDSSAALTR